MTEEKNAENAVVRLIDPSPYFQKHPWIALGGTMAVGYILGKWLFEENQHSPNRGQISLVVAPIIAKAVSNLLEAVKETGSREAESIQRDLKTLAINSFRDKMKQKFPQFTKEIEEALGHFEKVIN